MSDYVELYKELRPRVWKDLIGQQSIARALQSNILNNKLVGTYLFSGASGTGKTSTALILAKAVNCENLNPKNANPCNVCDTCIAIDEGTQIGINYFSAAQKSGVEDMRKIVEESTTKVPIKKQVFIIDEIHNASDKAFEALLVPVEDKKMSSIFILCTTEIEKVKDTLISRFQSFKFNKIDANTMEKYLEHINKVKELDISNEIIKEAVKKGRGNVRATLTYLETVRYTGELQGDTDFGEQLLEGLATKKIENVFNVISEASNNGISMRVFSEQLFEDLRNLLLYNAGVSEELTGIIPVDNPEKIIKGLLGNRGITLLLDEIGNAITQMSRGNDSRISLEIALVKGIEELRKLYKIIVARKGK